MKGSGVVLIVVGLLAYLFTGSIPGFEGKNDIIGIAFGVLGVILLAIGIYQEKATDRTLIRKSVTDDGTGNPVSHEETTKQKHGL